MQLFLYSGATFARNFAHSRPPPTQFCCVSAHFCLFFTFAIFCVFFQAFCANFQVQSFVSAIFQTCFQIRGYTGDP